MSRAVKELISGELRARYHDLDSALWVELRGADGSSTNDFRRDLRRRQMRLEVVKNSLFRRACPDGPLAGLARALRGPAALITGGESVVEAARVVERWLPRIRTLKLRGAVLEGQYLDETRVAALSRMPSKRELKAGIAGCLRFPGARLAAAVLAAAGDVAGCLKALIDRLERAEATRAA